MGQTLTHGIYLPDEGERNCYSGLAANWQLLDSSVGTIAEHTTALAGKAPAVHTHTKSQITDFPAYGNAAGTICEGNDSRLSDARTPVAHTHGKADITDLFNSANTWSGENTFSAANLFRKRAFTLGDNSSQIVRMEYKDTNNARWGILSFSHNTDNSVYCDLGVNCLKNDGQTTLNKSIRLLINPDNGSEFKPINDKAIDLGTSTNKWKSLNGSNPGALSLPSDNPSSINLDPTNWVTDGSNYNSYTPPSDGWLGILVNSADVSDLTGQYIFVGRTSNVNYWPQGFSVPLISDYNPNYLSGCVFMPVVSGKAVGIRIKMGKTQTEGSTITARFYPCQGNV